MFVTESQNRTINDVVYLQKKLSGFQTAFLIQINFKIKKAQSNLYSQQDIGYYSRTSRDFL
jgi:hypothetical protein